MDTQDILKLGRDGLCKLIGYQFGLITIDKPSSMDISLSLIKMISKLSPLVGNLIEHEVCHYLNELPEFDGLGIWKRQDPGFPDAIFEGEVHPVPGFEIKAWFPFATEITARFKESQKYFIENNTDLVLLAWLPEHLFYGVPTILDVISIPASQVAKSRDQHYYNPPDYLILEPEDTEERTKNLQQSCVNGHKFQGTIKELEEAREYVKLQGRKIKYYSYELDFQEEIQKIINTFRYRLDTNFAKIDRIDNDDIEKFKKRVLNLQIHGRSIQNWSHLFSRATESELESILIKEFGIYEE